MFYVLLFSLSLILFSVIFTINLYIKFKSRYHKQYSFFRNMIHQRRFEIYINQNADEFLRELLNYPMLYEDEKYIINCHDLTFFLSVHKSYLILHHVEINVNVISTDLISFETIKMIKDAQKKLTRQMKYC